jgi:hypothetical protein
MPEYNTNWALVGLYFLVIILVFVGFVVPVVALLNLILLIAGAYLGYQDAKGLGLGEMPDVWSPTVWAIMIFLFWLISLGVYLSKRRGYYDKYVQYLVSKPS